MTDRAETRQLRAFSEGEGDRWFQRNRSALGNRAPATDPPLRLVGMYDLQPRNVLEIGAANGYRLAALSEAYGCMVSGVEPSAAAVADGLSRFPGLRLQVGAGHAVPFDESFDLVIVNFVLHWVDRALLLGTVAEIDRVTVDEGYLVIGDFAPLHPMRRPYHHLPDQDVFTYKQDYASIFLSTGLYQPVAMLSGRHDMQGATSVVNDDERISTWLLRKRLDGPGDRIDP